LVLFVAATTTLSAQTDDFELLMQRVRREFARNPDIDKALAEYNTSDGSFRDVDYASIRRTNWPPLLHVDRMYDFAFAYTNPDNPHYRDASLFEKIRQGLAFWQQRNPWCHNWWYNQIAEPQRIGVLLIQMRAGERQLPAELEKQLLERMRTDGGDPAKWTGANRTDIALHWIYRACLTRDEAALRYALKNVYDPVAYTTAEGFQHDGSYFQHGRQLYIGGYGDEILKGVTQVALLVKDTPYAIPQEKLELISQFMRETYYGVIRGQYMMFGAVGRGISRPGNTRDTNIPAFPKRMTFAKRMIDLEPTRANEFAAIADRLAGTRPADYQVTPRHTHYFIGDYTLHARPAYSIGLRMVSTRTLRCEYGNGENLKTYFLSDGSMSIAVDGDEYAAIYPVWDWTRLPGTTAPRVERIPMAASDWQTPGTSTFAGGVSDSLRGASVYAYTDRYDSVDTSAKKAWFFFDDEVVCLGADINSLSPYPVGTTINQCLSPTGGNVVIAPDNKPDIPAGGGTAILASPEWVLHGKVAYLFPQGGTVSVSREKQRGSWYDINHTYSPERVEKQVFTIGLEHGSRPSDATYAYIVLPAVSTPDEVRRYLRRSDIRILSNTACAQIVEHRRLGLTQMICYEPGTYVAAGREVTVDKPCALMLLTNDKNDLTLHVADPGQTRSLIHVEVRQGGRQAVAECDFRDSGIYAGATKRYELRLR
jgi:chondroitin AC lyase